MLLWTGASLRQRDSAAPISAAEGRDPRDTRKHCSQQRGPRSLADALRETCIDTEDRFAFDRFDAVDWRLVVQPSVEDGPPSSNATIAPAEAFFRFSAFRYVFDESKKHSRLSHAALEEVLLEKNQHGNTIDKFYLDNPKRELPSLVHCTRAARSAYQRGWLPFISSDWLLDEGAMAALSLLGLAPAALGDEQPTLGRVKLGQIPDDTEIRGHIREVRWRRVDLANLAKEARDALLRFVEHQPSFGSSGPVAIGREACEPVRGVVANDSVQRPDRLAKLLGELDFHLARYDAEVRWEVRNSRLVDLVDLDGDLICEPNLVFRRDLRRLIAQLASESSSKDAGSSCRHVAECISVMVIGISWLDVARAISGDRFFEPLVCGTIAFDEHTRWVTPTDSDGHHASQPCRDIGQQAAGADDLVVWLQAQTDLSGNVGDFRVPEGEEAEKLREALAQIWHNG